MIEGNMRTILMCAVSLIMGACSSSPVEELNQTATGFIGDYSRFERMETDDGLKSFRYASDKIKSGVYHKVIIDPVAFYPKEVTSDQIHSALLEQTKNYIDGKYAEVIAPSFEIVDSPQAGAFRLTPRITALKTTSGDIGLKEIIPIGAVVALVKEAAGQRHQNVEIFMEVKVTDSLTGEFIGGSAKQGRGKEISGSNKDVDIDDIKPLLDVWIKDVQETFEKMSLLTANK